ncbi:alkaline phosphatase D family protein [Sandarakinorhabdus rubra]|uniref:alkaline phosphatase D family protein n=1 Tax=Sandarakinorhabdus rubra TaxID=2672568 RepID=UPI0013DAA018|nr:alkaline phosphatase D family protein [Sandarakinorhabdus rubra]
MRPAIDRRAFLSATAAGLILPVRPAFARLWPASGFTHGVASGHPGRGAVTLWTRYASVTGAATMLKLEVAEDEGMSRVIARAEAVAGPDSWGTAQVRLSGLPEGRWIWYRFTAPDGTQSMVGRTKTLASGKLSALKLGVVSCSNRPFGHFNAYAHLAARDDIDAVIHLGDYIYEYKAGTYPATVMPGREIMPADEIIMIDDYRQRYASYRADPGLAALHARFPMIAIWDDHEFANDAWMNGAENHNNGEGDWALRKAAALKAHREWLMTPERAWNRYDFGDLLSVITLDTRVSGRDKQLDLGAALRGGADGIKAFAGGEWQSPQRTLLGTEQEAWFAAEIAASVKAGQRWQLVAQQVVMGDLFTPKNAVEWLGADADPRATAYMKASLAANQAGIPGAQDMWSGYPQARRRLLKAMQDAGANPIVIAGDSHNAWAFNHGLDGKPVAAEFGVQSVTSPGYESALKADPAVIRAGLLQSSPGLTWCDTSRRGYLTLSFSPAETRCDWVFMDTIATPSLATTAGQAAVVKHGRRQMTLA